MSVPDMGRGLAPLSWGGLAGDWTISVGWLVVVALAGLAYAWGLMRARRLGEPLAPLRALSFYAGLAVLVVATQSGIETYAHVLFEIHMIQHLLTVMVVPALLVAGHPLTVLIRASSADHRPRREALLVSGPAAVLTFPLTGLAVYAVVIVATHLSSFAEAMLTHMWVHQLEMALYVVSGYWFLLPILGDEPIRWRPPYLLRMFVLFFAMAPDTVVGIVLLQTERNPLPALAHTGRTWGPSVIHDVHAAGGIMWSIGDGLMMAFIVALIIALISHQETSNAGSWLEGVRRSTMAGSIRAYGGDASTFDTDADLDDDEASLDAYNSMLQRLHNSDRRSSAATRR